MSTSAGNSAHPWIRTASSCTGYQDFLDKLPCCRLDSDILRLSVRIDDEAQYTISGCHKVVVDLLGRARGSTVLINESPTTVSRNGLLRTVV